MGEDRGFLIRGIAGCSISECHCSAAIFHKSKFFITECCAETSEYIIRNLVIYGFTLGNLLISRLTA